MERLVDIDHPLVQETADKLTEGLIDPHEKLERIFRFVRDDILFGFPPEGDFVAASETIKRGYGQCNTKGILFLALCKAVGIPARLHYSRISKEIQRGFFTGIEFWLMPNEVSHSWLEVQIDGKWHPIDTYINDLPLHNAAVGELRRRGWETGFSVSRAGGKPSADLVLDEAHYSQMAAVVGDHGTWDEPTEYFSGPDYLNRVGPLRQWLYRLALPSINRRVRQLRETGSSSVGQGAFQ